MSIIQDHRLLNFFLVITEKIVCYWINMVSVLAWDFLLWWAMSVVPRTLNPMAEIITENIYDHSLVITLVTLSPSHVPLSRSLPRFVGTGASALAAHGGGGDCSHIAQPVVPLPSTILPSTSIVVSLQTSKATGCQYLVGKNNDKLWCC